MTDQDMDDFLELKFGQDNNLMDSSDPKIIKFRPRNKGDGTLH